MTPRRVFICLLAIAVDWRHAGLGADPKPIVDPSDCGTRALYHLLRMEGRPVDFNRLRASLGASGPEGHSFRELRDAAGRFRLALDAVVLPKLRSAITGPTLVFLKNGSQGHFVVVRPVGHTGLLVQMLDGEQEPIVGDADRLFASPTWTGLALVPHRTNYLMLAAAGVSTCCMTAFGLLTWARRRRSA
jgi:ABC-type bacteriocin/lantibiotic exporter with double-glycine peptidase domain